MKWVTEEQHQAILDRLVAIEKQLSKKHDATSYEATTKI